MIFGGSPAAGMTVGAEMIRAIGKSYLQQQAGASTSCAFPRRDSPNQIRCG
jgi:hypothetical protein